MKVERYQGSTDFEGDCPAETYDGFACTLDTNHGGLHEAWGAAPATMPHAVWGECRHATPLDEFCPWGSSAKQTVRGR